MKYAIEQSTLTAIGDSIRAKSGLTEAISPLQMPSAIASISSGGGSDDTLKGLIEKSLTEIVIPEGTASIGNHTFYGFSSLTSVTIPESVTSIGAHAFYNCTGLTSVTIPESVTSIGNSMFYNCRALASVTIPESVTSIGEYAFGFCTLMEKIHLKRTTPPTLANKNAFYRTPSTRIIYVPQGCLEAYQTATNWSNYASYMVEEE